MSYTVKQLAKISGVSVRTLHFYDEIGILKPAYYGNNKYRYYKEKELLILQQILFYRELGFQLSDIQRILSNPDFDKITALESHRTILENKLDHTKTLIETLNKTIAHLRGDEIVKLEEIFDGFDPEKQRHYEDYLIDHGVDKTVLDQSKDNIKHWRKEDWIEIKQEGDQIHTALVQAIHHHLDPDSSQVQALIQKHYDLTKSIWVPNRASYIALSDLYASHPDFVAFYHKQHPQLLDFLRKAMRIFAEKSLS